jgi:anti-sigma B factor antagonist
MQAAPTAATAKEEDVMGDFSTRTTESGVVVVQPTGRLNMVAAPTLRKQLNEIVDGGVSKIVVDLSATEFIDSSGLGALIAALKIARKAGGDLRIAAPTQQVCTVLELSNLDRVLRSYASADSAFDE